MGFKINSHQSVTLADGPLIKITFVLCSPQKIVVLLDTRLDILLYIGNEIISFVCRSHSVVCRRCYVAIYKEKKLR